MDFLREPPHKAGHPVWKSALLLAPRSRVNRGLCWGLQEAPLHEHRLDKHRFRDTRRRCAAHTLTGRKMTRKHDTRQRLVRQDSAETMVGDALMARQYLSVLVQDSVPSDLLRFAFCQSHISIS